MAASSVDQIETIEPACCYPINMEIALHISPTSFTARIGLVLRKRLEEAVAKEPPVEITRLLSQLERISAEEEPHGSPGRPDKSRSSQNQH